ncbi:hypothetical protein JG687_00009936 [Phytophthora cactorum]|uniref:Uncharacterized protein n=1 Tax=Phytophthora cactorum TaxID=29920 RepID=A0A8T1UD96_9STRA|nr:hypothetical protein JG687_00009936 [Phytophthora cactorum]
MTVISCAKNMNPSLATDIKVFLLSRGVILTTNARGFVVASPTSPVASGLSSVEDPHLNRVDVHPGRFVFCSDTASTVGLTLRGNGTQYAATNAVYTRQVRFHALDELAFYGDKLLALSTTDTTLSRGLGPRSLILVRKRDSVQSSISLLRVQGFLYFRCVGDHPSRFLSGGDASNSYKFNNREEQDFGYDNMRVMIELPDEGIVYCRGVGDNHTNPEMACVLFDSEGNVRDRYAYLGKLGRWNDIVQ